jgi:CDGSH-type Zn-finger protein
MEPRVVENLKNSEGEPLSTIHGVALCRCGASNNKPFCDGTHEIIGFRVK